MVGSEPRLKLHLIWGVLHAALSFVQRHLNDSMQSSKRKDSTLRLFVVIDGICGIGTAALLAALNSRACPMDIIALILS